MPTGSIFPPATGDAAPRAELVMHGDLAQALRALRDRPTPGSVVSVSAPRETPLRAFLREHGRPSGGWLNRSWALPVSEMPALAHLAEAHPPLAARLFRHDPASPADSLLREPHQDDAPTPCFWVWLDDDRRAPPERALPA